MRLALPLLLLSASALAAPTAKQRTRLELVTRTTAALSNCPAQEAALLAIGVPAVTRDIDEGAITGIDVEQAIAELEEVAGRARSACGQADPVEIVTPPPPPAQPLIIVEKGVVAVLPLLAKNLDPTAKELLEEAIRTIAGDALSPKGFTVLTGETTLSLLQGNGVDVQKACEASCALEAARELKAKLFLSGTAAKSEGEFVAFIRLFDSATGRQLASVELEGNTARELRKAFAAKADVLFGRVRAKE